MFSKSGLIYNSNKLKLYFEFWFKFKHINMISFVPNPIVCVGGEVYSAHINILWRFCDCFHKRMASNNSNVILYSFASDIRRNQVHRVFQDGISWTRSIC